MKRPTDNKLHIAAKVIMTAIFVWSGFFWSGVSIINFYFFNPEDAHLAPPFLFGSLLILLSLILCWLKLYILQIIPCVTGFIVYLQPVKEMIDHVAGRGVYFKPTFEQRYMPMIGLVLISLALFIGRVWTLIAAKAEKKNEFNNLPTESILEKRRGE